MIVILHQRRHQDVSHTVGNNIATAFSEHLTVALIEAETAAKWPAPEISWDDLLVVVFDGSSFPDAGNQFIAEYLKQRGDDSMLLPVALDAGSQKPPQPSEAIKALLYDSSAVGEHGRLTNASAACSAFGCKGDIQSFSSPIVLRTEAP